MTHDHVLDTSPLRQNVRLLGDTLGEIIRTTVGEGLFQSIESIRQASKLATEAEKRPRSLTSLNASMLNSLLISRGFAQFLNLANIADQRYNH